MRARALILSVGAVLALLVSGHAQVSFTRVAGEDLLPGLGNTGSWAWGDFNNDGLLDVFFTGTTNYLYRNNGGGAFTRITQGNPVEDAGDHITGVWGDYDNDGNIDLLVSAGVGAPTASRNQLFHNNGNGTFSRVDGSSLTNQTGYFGPCTWVDYDNDGFLDCFIPNHGDSDNHGGKNLLLHNDRNGNFTSVTSGAVVNDVSVGWCVQWADYDNDGLMDLLVINNGYQAGNSVNFLYHNEGYGKFARVLTNVVATDHWASGALSCAWGDYNNDGFQDLFVTADGGSEPNRLYRNNGDGTFTSDASAPMVNPPAGGFSSDCGWGDYDNDGYLDLFVSNAEGNNSLFHNNGDGTFTQAFVSGPSEDGGPGLVCYGNWVDYDNDGFLDLFVAIIDESGQAPMRHVLYHNDGNSNAWMEIKCVGTVANRSAIGTKVRLKATIGGKPVWQLREINNGGAFGQQPLVAHFGLGDATNVDTVRIEWPSATVQEFHDWVPRQIHTVVEPPRLSASRTNGSMQFTLKGARGFQYDVQTSSNLLTWSTLSTLTISDPNGSAVIDDTNASRSLRRFYRGFQRSQGP